MDTGYAKGVLTSAPNTFHATSLGFGHTSRLLAVDVVTLEGLNSVTMVTTRQPECLPSRTEDHPGTRS